MGNIKGYNMGNSDELGNNITIDGLIEQLDVFRKGRKFTKYNITEDFNKVGKHTYSVYNLKASLVKVEKDNLVMFDDDEHIIREDLKRVLMMFPLCNLETIEHDLEYGKTYKALLTFKDGTILIERIKDNQ